MPPTLWSAYVEGCVTCNMYHRIDTMHSFVECTFVLEVLDDGGGVVGVVVKDLFRILGLFFRSSSPDNLISRIEGFLNNVTSDESRCSGNQNGGALGQSEVLRFACHLGGDILDGVHFGDLAHVECFAVKSLIS